MAKTQRDRDLTTAWRRNMTKACWYVCLPCGKRFPMVGSKCDHDEALVHALGIWPHCWVE